MNEIQTSWLATRPRWMVWIGLSIIGWAIMGWSVEKRGLWSAHEGRAAQNAQSMIEDGHWLMPTLFIDQPDYQKPPMYYWLVALASEFHHGHVDSLTVRVPSVLCGILCLIFVYHLGRRLFGGEVGIWAAVVLATITRFAWLGRVGRIDMPLTFCCVSSLYLFWRNFAERWERPNGNPHLPNIFYVILGFGVLLKGPVAICHVAFPIMTYMLWSKIPFVPMLQEGWRKTWECCRIKRGFLIVLLMSAPWYLYAIWYTGGVYFWQFFIYHNVERALGTSDGLKSAPLWFYIPRLATDAFPWSVLLPVIALTFWKQRETRMTPPNRFVVCWFVTQFTFLSMVSFKRADYLLPVMPALALMVAGWLKDRYERFETRRANKPAGNPMRRYRLVVAIASMLAVAVIPLLFWSSSQFLKKGIVRSLLKIDDRKIDYLNTTDRFMLEHIERIIRENGSILLIGGVVMVACIWVFETGWLDRKSRRILSGLAIPWAICFLFQIHVMVPAIDPLREMSRFGEVVRTLATKDQTVYYFGKFDADLVFHVGRPARIIFEGQDGWNELHELGDSEDVCFVVMKSSVWEAAQKDPKMAHWLEIADVRDLAFGEHLDPRVLISNRHHPDALAGRPRNSFLGGVTF